MLRSVSAPYRLVGIFSARPKSPTTAVYMPSSLLIRQFCECRKTRLLEEVALKKKKEKKTFVS